MGVKKCYIIRGYNANPASQDCVKMIKGSLLMHIMKMILKMFYDYVDVQIRYL